MHILDYHHRLRIVEDRPRDARTHSVADCWELMGFPGTHSRVVVVVVVLMRFVFFALLMGKRLCHPSLSTPPPLAAIIGFSRGYIHVGGSCTIETISYLVCIKLSSSQLKTRTMPPHYFNPLILYRSPLLLCLSCVNCGCCM